MTTSAQNAQSQGTGSRSRGYQNGSENPALATIEAWLSMNRPMMSAMTEINGRLIEHVSRANDEWIEFMTRRFNDDLAASQKLMACRTIEDVFAAYAELFHRAQRHYQAEFQSFARLNKEFADDTANLVKSHIEATANEIRH
jgi:phasin protein